ncbi:MAG: cytochrome c [Alphaproteobacteria bacterium]|nr:cytochrome c [Alphaproteobacteria bacterium]
MAKIRPYAATGILAILVGLLFWYSFLRVEEPPQIIASSSSDMREAIHLNAEQGDFALRQMRGLLVTLAEIDEAEFADNLAAAAEMAATQEPGKGPPNPAGFQAALPDPFRALSRQMREDFRRASQAAEAGNLEEYAAAKRSINNACISCHESYRFDVADK